VRAALELVQLRGLEDRPAPHLSGGQQQRLALARAFVMEPKVLLLDEPFGALDALTRAHLQDEVIRIQSELGNTVLMITHDVDEAVLMSDRVVMMTNGPAATIGQILPVPLERPRNRIALAEDKVYNHCRQEILSFLYEKQRKVETLAPRTAGAFGRKDEAVA
jgi:nitrate/nitrite transport system ATP-binding protein